MLQDFLDEAFDTDTEECSQPFPLIPTGRYEAEIIKATAGTTKNGKGLMVYLNWSIKGGEYENRTVFQNILLQHESEEAQKFGRQRFADVLAALGISGKVSDLTVLHHKPCMIGITIRKDKAGQYPDKNEVGRVTAMPTSHNGPTRKEVRKAVNGGNGSNGSNGSNGELNDDLPF
jgi:hypothetical protein